MKENIIIAGSSGAIGGEFIKLYANNSNVEKIIALSRSQLIMITIKFNPLKLTITMKQHLKILMRYHN